MHLFDDLKLIALAVPLLVALANALRSHNDRLAGPPPEAFSDPGIERLVKRGRKAEAIRTLRTRYGYNPHQARKLHDHLKARLAKP